MEIDEQELKPRGLCGLNNIGNTCYMNSALQSLSNCPQLTHFFLKFDEFETLPTNEKLTVAKCYKDLISQLWNKKRPKQLTPSPLLRAIRIQNSTFRGYAQQDTQEFLRCLMDRLHEELKHPEVTYAKSLNVNGGGDDDDNEDSESAAQCNKKLLGGNRTYDDSPEDMDIDEEQSNVLLYSQKSVSKESRSLSTSKRQRSESESSRKRKCLTKSKNPSQEIKYRSIITCVFDGKLLSSVQCLTCKRISNTVETFQDLSLPIPSKDDLNHMHTQAVLTCSSRMYNDTSWMPYVWDWIKSWFVGPDIKLQDCLSAFFTNDELKGDNMYNCEKCKKLRNGLKYSRVYSLPEVLCIHLKRFRHELYHSSKINTYISFPIRDLDLSLFLSKDSIQAKSTSKYDLTAIICHFGNVGGGHYIAYAKNCINNKWYEFNDSRIQEVPETTVAAAEAYVLFYSLKDSDAENFRKHINSRLKTTDTNLHDVRYISKEWLNRFDSCVQPGSICNYDFICEHGGISLHFSSRIQSLFVPVPRSISNELLKRFGGGPEISTLEVCPLCMKLEERKLYELETFSKLYQEFQEGENVKISYQISMTWYDAWYDFVTGKTSEYPGPINNDDITDDESSYGLISKETWQFLRLRYGGGPELTRCHSEDEEKESEEEGMGEEERELSASL